MSHAAGLPQQQGFLNFLVRFGDQPNDGGLNRAIAFSGRFCLAHFGLQHDKGGLKRGQLLLLFLSHGCSLQWMRQANGAASWPVSLAQRHANESAVQFSGTEKSVISNPPSVAVGGKSRPGCSTLRVGVLTLRYLGFLQVNCSCNSREI